MPDLGHGKKTPPKHEEPIHITALRLKHQKNLGAPNSIPHEGFLARKRANLALRLFVKFHDLLRDPEMFISNFAHPDS